MINTFHTGKLAPKIYFYISAENSSAEAPFAANGKGLTVGDEINTSILQVYVNLKDRGINCERVNEIPPGSIAVVAHEDLEKLPNRQNLHLTNLVVCLYPKLPSSYCGHLNIIDNRAQEQLFLNSYFIPPQPSPLIIPRDRSLKERFQTVVYLGELDDLAIELRYYSFFQQVVSLNLRWRAITKINSCYDYSDVDAIIAVRSFDPEHLRLTGDYASKSGAQLYNAWWAGVPAILGSESAYRHEYKTPLDYLEVNSISDVISALVRLRDDWSLRQEILENYGVRKQEITPTKLADKWCEFFTEVAIPAYYRWGELLTEQKLAVSVQNNIHHAQQSERAAAAIKELNILRSKSLPYDLSEKC